MRASPPLYLQSPCYFFSHRASAARAAVAGTYIMLEVNMLTLIVKGQCAFERFKKDISGASLVEYSLLIGLITVAAVVAIGAVAVWVNGQWDGLKTAVGA